MKQYLNRYLEMQSKTAEQSKNTIKMKKLVLEDFFEYLNDQNISIEVIEDWINTKDAQKTTKKQYVGLIRGFLDWCIDRDYWTGKNPAKVVLNSMGKAHDRNPDKRKVFSLNEVKSIIKNTLHPRDRTILLTLAKTGCRVSELCALNVENIDFVNNTIKITCRKGDQGGSKNTLIPLDNELAQSLKIWLQMRGNQNTNALFTSFMHEGLGNIAIWQIVREAGKRIGINDAHPHCFRHFFTSILNERRCHPEVISILRGDSKRDMTSYYTHLDFEMIKKEYFTAMPKLL